MIWNDEFETLPREALEALQLNRLKKIVEKVRATVPFYKEKFNKLHITDDSIRNLSDIRKLPFTTKDDLRDNYPFNMFAVPKYQVIRLHASSGTTGKPTVVGYTRKDIEIWKDLIARIMVMG
jgi:phenylacetate-CoA ligase